MNGEEQPDACIQAIPIAFARFGISPEILNAPFDLRELTP
jgi:hypothetical protein